MTNSQFVNESKRMTCTRWGEPLRVGDYGYDKPSKYLYMFGGLVQRLVAQCGTKMLSNHWMKTPQNYTIYKCEGGCRIEGHGDLVLGQRSCYFDFNHDKSEEVNTLAAFITEIVLAFDPLRPQSLVDAAANHIDVTPTELGKQLEKMNSSIFGGDALSNFFNHNPFSDSPMLKMQDYEKYIRVNVFNEDEKDVDFSLSTKNKGKELLDKMNKAISKRSGSSYIHRPMCCSPSYSNDKNVRFWINTGRSTCIDGWKSEEEIISFIDRIYAEGVQFFLNSDTMRC